MSRYYSGKDGALYYSEYVPGVTVPVRKVAKCIEWSMTTTMSMLDTTALGDTETTAEAGLRSHGGSCKVLYYADDQGENAASTLLQSLLEPRLDPLVPEQAGPAVIWRLQLRLDESPTNFRRIQGPVWITRASMAMAVGQIFAMDFDYQFIGAPVSVTL